MHIAKRLQDYMAIFQTHCHPMPILGRWDGSDDDDAAPPARVRAGAWRFDESDDDDESEKTSDSNSSGLLGCLNGLVGIGLLAKKILLTSCCSFWVWI